MKYLAIASFAAVAAATPALQARDSWEPAPKPVDPTTTWNEWESVKTTTTTKPTGTSTWVDWDGKGPNPPKPSDHEVDWEEWNKHPVYTTTIVTAITTYCPEPTKITHAGKTWTVDKATTLTITDCPCTISVPVWTKTSTSCKDKPTPVDDKSTWANYPAPSSKTPVDDKSTWANYPAPSSKTPVDDKSTWANYPAPSSTKPDASSTWAQWSETKKVPVATWTGAANKLNAGAGLAGILGAAALLL